MNYWAKLTSVGEELGLDVGWINEWRGENVREGVCIIQRKDMSRMTYCLWRCSCWCSCWSLEAKRQLRVLLALPLLWWGINKGGGEQGMCAWVMKSIYHIRELQRDQSTHLSLRQSLVRLLLALFSLLLLFLFLLILISLFLLLQFRERRKVVVVVVHIS